MMDIEWKHTQKGRRFDWISQGDTFEHEGQFFIKSNVDSETGAVCLHDGHRYHFDASTLVTPVKIKAYAEEVENV